MGFMSMVFVGAVLQARGDETAGGFATAFWRIAGRFWRKGMSKPSEESLIHLWLSHSACHVYILEFDAIRATPAPI